MKNKVLIINGVLLVSILASCVSSNRFSKVAAGENIFHDTLQNLGAAFENQNKKIDSLQSILENARFASNEELEKTREQVKVLETKLAEKENTLNKMKEVVGLQQKAVNELKQQVCDALKCYTPEELNVVVKNGKLYVSLSDKLLFPTGSDVVNKRGKEAIKQLSDVLKNNEMEIVVEGHTDEVPIHNKRNLDNWDLSVHRATSVTRLLTDYGIEAKRVTAAGRSKYIPVSNNKTEKGRQLNRRTEIVLAPNLDKLWDLTTSENINDYSKELSNLNK